jgi:hypothetical protein
MDMQKWFCFGHQDRSRFGDIRNTHQENKRKSGLPVALTFHQ